MLAQANGSFGGTANGNWLGNGNGNSSLTALGSLNNGGASSLSASASGTVAGSVTGMTHPPISYPSLPPASSWHNPNVASTSASAIPATAVHGGAESIDQRRERVLEELKIAFLHPDTPISICIQKANNFLGTRGENNHIWVTSAVLHYVRASNAKLKQEQTYSHKRTDANWEEWDEAMKMMIPKKNFVAYALMETFGEEGGQMAEGGEGSLRDKQMRAKQGAEKRYAVAHAISDLKLKLEDNQASTSKRIRYAFRLLDTLPLEHPFGDDIRTYLFPGVHDAEILLRWVEEVEEELVDSVGLLREITVGKRRVLELDKDYRRAKYLGGYIASSIDVMARTGAVAADLQAQMTELLELVINVDVEVEACAEFASCSVGDKQVEQMQALGVEMKGELAELLKGAELDVTIARQHIIDSLTFH